MAAQEVHDKLRAEFRNKLAAFEAKHSNAKRDLYEAEYAIKYWKMKQAGYYLFSMLSMWVKLGNMHEKVYTAQALKAFVKRRIGEVREET